MIYNEQISQFQEPFDKDNSFTVRHFNIQSLSIKIFKVINNIAATIIKDLYTTYHSSFAQVCCSKCVTVHNGQSYIQYYNSLIWIMIPGCIKDSGTLDIFQGHS